MATITSYDAYPRSSFPGSVDDWDNMQDITSTTAAYMDAYNELIAAGNYTDAATYLSTHSDLEQCLFNAEKINQLMDGVKATQQFFLEDVADQVANITASAVGINDDASTDAELAVNAYSASKVLSLDHAITQITLSASGWSSSSPYTQAIAVSGVTADSVPVLSLYLSSSDSSSTRKSQKKAWSYVDKAESSTDTITFYCYDTKPTTSFMLNVARYL